MLWQYILLGIVMAWLGVGLLIFLAYLKDRYEEIFVAIVLVICVTVVGAVLGYVAYDQNTKKLPAEAPIESKGK